MGMTIDDSCRLKPMSKEEIVEALKTMVFGVQAFERFNAKERKTLDEAWTLIDQYENRLKADMVAMLEELKEQLREMHEDFFETEHFDEAYGVSDSMDVIQQKINELKIESENKEMTNGEKFKQIFSITQVDDCDLNVYAWLPIHDAIEIPVEWWNAEYKEPTTKNDINVPENNVGKIEPVIRDNGVKDELNRVKDELEPTTKNDLGVDCISREATVKRLCNLAEYMNEHKENGGDPYIMAALFIQDNKTEFPSVTPQQLRWIPVSERLPEIHQDVILSLRSLDIEVGFRAKTEPYFYCHGADGCYIEPQNVLAWQPLPEPYNEESEEIDT